MRVRPLRLITIRVFGWLVPRLAAGLLAGTRRARGQRAGISTVLMM
jgi:hypothetical protein